MAALKRRRGGGDELLAYKERPPLARPALGRHQRVHQGRDGRRLLGQGLPDLERDGAGRRRARGARRGGGLARPAASARSRARSRRWRTTSATRPRSAAPPTSTRACSTPTAAGLVIGLPLHGGRRRRAGELPIHHRAVEEAVLDLIDEREGSRPSRGSPPRLGAAGRAGRRRVVGRRGVRRLGRGGGRLAVRRRVRRRDRLLRHDRLAGVTARRGTSTTGASRRCTAARARSG